MKRTSNTMKKVFSLVLILAIVFTISACGYEPSSDADTAVNDTLTYQELNRQMIETYDTSMVEYAYAFGLPDDIHWIDDMTTEADFQNNILYLLLIGDYGINLAFPKDTSQEYLDNWGCKIVALVHDFGLETYDALAAFYDNEGIAYRINKVKGFPVIEIYSSVDLDLCKEALDFKKVFEEQKQGLKDAITLKDKLHSDGTITEEMTQKEIMNAYYDALAGYAESDKESSDNMEGVPGKKFNYNCSTIYGFHSLRCSVCSGRAAGFGLSMRLEGIPCYGICVPNHEINVCFIDGEEYYIDTGNQIPASNFEPFRKIFGDIELNSDNDARNALKRLNGETIPDLEKEIKMPCFYNGLNLVKSNGTVNDMFYLAKGETIEGILIGGTNKDNIVSDVDFDFRFELEGGIGVEPEEFNFKHEGNKISFTIPADFDESNLYFYYYTNENYAFEGGMGVLFINIV